MRSGKSFFNKTLYIHDLKRGWPIWLTYFFVYLFPLVSVVQNYGRSYGRNALEFANEEIYFFTAMTPVVAFIFAVLAAMTLFNYLYHSRSANGLHALPLKREGHFLTHYAAGMSYFIIPNAVLAVLTLVFELYLGEVNISVILLNFVYMTLIVLFFFSFAVFCAQFAGHVVALPAFYVIWNFFFLVLTFIVQQMLTLMLYGFRSVSRISEVAMNLTPVVRLMEKVDSWSLANQAATFWIVVYGAVGCVFAVAALLIYRRRQLETAGDVIAIRQAKPVFRYGIAFFFGSGMAFFTMAIFSIYNDVFFYAAMVLWGLVGYYVAEMLLQKNFRVLKKGFKGAMGYALVMLVLFVGIRSDLSGFERRVPAPEQVESIQISGLHTIGNDTAGYRHNDFSTVEEIEALTDVHQAILNHRSEVDDYNDAYNITITYQLKDGSDMTRAYTVPYTMENMSNPSYAAHKLLRLINRPDYLRNKFFPPSIQMSDFIQSSFSIGSWAQKSSHSAQIFNDSIFTAEETRQLYLAISEDLSAGRIGQQGSQFWDPGSNTVRTVFSTQDGQVYEMPNIGWDSPKLTLVYYGMYEEWEHCSIEYSYSAKDGESRKKIADSYNAEFMLVETATSTIAVLEKLTGMTATEIIEMLHAAETIYR